MIKTIIFILIIVAGLYYGFRYFNSNGYLAPFNNKINSFINNKPKIACVEDSDCHLTQTDCSPCSCGFVANKAWQPFCPFQPEKDVICAPCEKFPQKENIKCINTECKIVY